MIKNYLKVKNIYGVIKNEVEILSESKEKIDRELAIDIIRGSSRNFNQPIWKSRLKYL